MGLLQLPVGSGWVCDCNSDDPKRIWPCVRKESFTRELGPAFTAGVSKGQAVSARTLETKYCS